MLLSDTAANRSRQRSPLDERRLGGAPLATAHRPTARRWPVEKQAASAAEASSRTSIESSKHAESARGCPSGKENRRATEIFFPVPASLRRALDDVFFMPVSRARRNNRSDARTCLDAIVDAFSSAGGGHEETLVDGEQRTECAASFERFAKRRRLLPNGRRIAGRDSLREANRAAFRIHQVIENQAFTKTPQIAAQTRSTDCDGQIATRQMLLMDMKGRFIFRLPRIAAKGSSSIVARYRAAAGMPIDRIALMRC